jgi:preprotein translocase subunit SecF
LFKKAFAIILSGILLSTIFGAQTAEARAADPAEQASEVRAKVQKMGVGADARVEVKLRDDSKVKGYVSAANEESFTVTDSKTGAARTFDYAEVSRVNKAGGSSTRKKILIGAAVAAGVIVGIIFAREALCDGGAQDRGIC